MLLVLWESAEPATVGGLGERLLLDSGTLTPLLKRMEAHGLVARARSSRDERVVEVRLTAKGRRLKARALAIPGAVLCRSALSVEDAGRLRDELLDLLHTLQAPSRRSPNPRSNRKESRP